MLRLSAAPAADRDGTTIPVLPLALGQLLAWGTLYYGIAFLAPAIHADRGWPLGAIFGAFSGGLLLSALLAWPVGRALARHGGRKVMSCGSLTAGVAFAVLAASDGLVQFYVAWLLAGAAMSMTLYEAAFSTLHEGPQTAFRRAVGLVTIVGGLASTLSWPLTHWLTSEYGWRAAAWTFAVLHACVCLPLHRSLPALRRAPSTPTQPGHPIRHDRATAWLAVAFALGALVTSAVSAHIAVMLDGLHVPPGQALLAAALIGPMQVAARLLEWRWAHRVSAFIVGRFAFLGLALGLCLLAAAHTSVWLVFAFVVLYGSANGLLTVMRGSAVAELSQRGHYAATLGMTATPTLLARALGPLAIAAVVADRGATTAVWLLALCAGAAFAAFSVVADERRSRAKSKATLAEPIPDE